MDSQPRSHIAIPRPGFKVKFATYRLTNPHFAEYPAGGYSGQVLLRQDVRWL